MLTIVPLVLVSPSPTCIHFLSIPPFSWSCLAPPSPPPPCVRLCVCVYACAYGPVRTVCTVPLIDAINGQKYTVEPQGGGDQNGFARGAWDWSLLWKRVPLGDREKKRRETETEPYRYTNPALATGWGQSGTKAAVTTALTPLICDINPAADPPHVTSDPLPDLPDHIKVFRFVKPIGCSLAVDRSKSVELGAESFVLLLCHRLAVTLNWVVVMCLCVGDS